MQCCAIFSVMQYSLTLVQYHLRSWQHQKAKMVLSILIGVLLNNKRFIAQILMNIILVELAIQYFAWDNISQYSCNNPIIFFHRKNNITFYKDSKFNLKTFTRNRINYPPPKKIKMNKKFNSVRLLFFCTNVYINSNIFYTISWW